MAAGAKKYRITCAECGKDEVVSRPEARFCCNPCKTSWNNRRQQRGAQLYDLLMTCRYDREVAKENNVWTLLCRMAEHFKAEDDEAGRKSWTGFEQMRRDGRLTRVMYAGKSVV
jgi:hypothetical protein